MSATARDAADLRDRTARQQERQARKELARVEKGTKPLLAFWTKVNNDWTFNLSAMLAYNFLMSTFPILLVLLAVAGLVLGALSPTTMSSLTNAINGFLPGGAHVVAAVTHQLEHSAGILLAVGLVTAAFAGSRLFIAIESCFDIIFRLRSRNPLRQNLMAFGMLLIYVILIPVVALASLIPSAILKAISSLGHNGPAAFLTQVLGIAIAIVFAAILFAVIYIVVPNRTVRLGEVWQGTLVAAALLTIYQILFPVYVSRILHPSNYGSLAGFAIVILLFFYYLGFILLLGAQVNSWASGQRQTAGNIGAVLHEVQAHGTTRGAAGPTAGLPREDLQGGKGAAAMQDTSAAIAHERQDHQTEIHLPPAEAALPGSPDRTGQPRERRDAEAARQVQGQPVAASLPAPDGTATPPFSGAAAGRNGRLRPSGRLGERERRALAAVVLAAGAVVVPVVARLLGIGQGGSGRPTATA